MLNLQRSSLLTCTEEPHAELIHQELKTSACPWRQQAPVPFISSTHVVDGQDVVFRADRGSKLSAADRKDHVAFEADDWDLRTRTGWSVLLKGRAEVVHEVAVPGTITSQS